MPHDEGAALVSESVVKEREKNAKIEGLQMAAKAVCAGCDWGFPIIGSVGSTFYHSCDSDHSYDCKSPQKCSASEIQSIILNLTCDS